MAGHSKWANIKHKKSAADAKRGKIFTKIAKEITVAAKLGGDDENSNPRLRRAVSDAKAVSMPKDNITRAIKKGVGDLDGATYEEVTFEGYGAGGVAILVDCLTDNRNRTLHEVRFSFNKGEGNMGEMGCVNWMFEQKGVFSFEKSQVDLEKLQDYAIEVGIEDIEEDDEYITLYSQFEDYDKVKEALEKGGFKPSRSEISKIPQNTVAIEGDVAVNVIKLIQTLEDLDDVQKVYANFDISDVEMEKVSELI